MSDPRTVQASRDAMAHANPLKRREPLPPEPSTLEGCAGYAIAFTAGALLAIIAMAIVAS